MRKELTVEEYKESNNNILKAWRLHNEFINNSNPYNMESVDYLIELNDDQQYLCAGYTNTPYFSINPIYVGTDSKLHISEFSVAGDIVNNKNFDENIENYNHGMYLDRMKIRKVYFPDGTEKEYAV